MRSRDEGIETVFASYANMTEEKKQKFTQVTAAITSGLPPMSACFNDRLDGANQLAVAKWTVSMSYLVHEIIKGSITKLVGFRVPDIVPSAHVK